MDKQPFDVGATLESILLKLESIDRLETKLDAATNRMSEELDILPFSFLFQ